MLENKCGEEISERLYTYHSEGIVADCSRIAEWIGEGKICVEQFAFVEIDHVAYLGIFIGARIDGIQIAADNEHFAKLLVIECYIEIVLHSQGLGIQLKSHR